MEHRSFHQRVTLCLFGCSIFVSAFLLFQVQPLIGKFILPWFGGSPSVWTTCLLFFQVMLFAGYTYAHLLNRWLTAQRQIVFHCSLLVAAVLLLPITPGMEWKPSGEESPTFLILTLLTCKIGLHYFLLSATGPLLQSWLGSTNACESPYRLYSLSNLGSMLALLSFPFLIEPGLSSVEQSRVWSAAFVVFVALCSLSGWVLFRANQKEESREIGPGLDWVDWPTRLAWFCLPCLACVLLLSTTNQICMDTGSIPFLWIAPLAVYLLSFILTFDSQRWYRRRLYVMLSAVVSIVIYSLKLAETAMPLWAEVGLVILGLFSSCMVCHGEVVAIKPSTKRMTEFYLTLSAGGAAGGLFVGLLAPNLFNGYFEWQLGLLASVLLLVDISMQSTERWRQWVTPRIKVFAVSAILIAATIMLSVWNSLDHQVLAIERNFYGVLGVARRMDPHSGEILRDIVHGRIIHGTQWESSERRVEPTSYYTPLSGVGIALTRHHPQQPRHVGVVGLGAGTLAAYGKAGDTFRFYEINPVVMQLAESYFWYLSDSLARIHLVLGDARLMLDREPSQEFDLLVLDAFSGDAIPVHLLTQEAMQLYDRHLKPDGVIAFHISNLYFDLQPIIAGLANANDYKSAVVLNEEDPSQCSLRSLWVLLARDSQTILELFDESSAEVPDGLPVLWTDDRNNLFEALR